MYGIQRKVYSETILIYFTVCVETRLRMIEESIPIGEKFHGESTSPMNLKPDMLQSFGW